MPEIPRVHLVPLQEQAARIIEMRAIENEPTALARELLVGFHDLCLRFGLDGLLADLGLTNDVDGAEHPEIRAAVAAKLANKAEFDPRGPRNAKPAQLAQCVLGALGVTVVDPPDRTLTFGDAVRSEVAAALTRAIEPALAVPKIREDIISWARTRIEEQHLSAFEKIAAQLDERGMRIVKQPKVPLDAVQAVQQKLFDARNAVLDKAVSPAIDRAKEVLARTSAEAAERFDQPITLKLTPRQVAIRRITDPRVPKVPAAIAHAVLESLCELAHITWQALEKPVRPYSASQNYVVGELIEHPKFGKGAVVGISLGRIDVEFAETKATLVQKK